MAATPKPKHPAPTATIRPQPGPQTTFLETPADLAVYGGSAGGGKSWAELVEPLRHIANPRFGAVIFRRESPQITNEGGLWDESQALYPLFGGVPRVGDLDWKFPSGAKVSFRHLQHEADKLKWSGSAVPLIQYDELNHFTASQFWFMLSRNRSTCGVRPYVRATTNPGPGWVKELLAQWVDRTHPAPAKSGEIRWFVRVKGELIWAKTRADLKARHPALEPKSFTFIRASVFDNKVLMEKDPGYLANLQALPEVERLQLLEGDWDAKREGLCFPELASCVVDLDPKNPPTGRKVGGIDFGWNHPFVALSGVVDHDDCLWVTFERYKSFVTLPTHSAAIPRDGTLYHADPASPSSIAELCHAGHHVMPCTHKGKHPIKEGIDRVTERIRTGRLKISRACQDLLRESLLYVFDPKTGEPVDEDNHACDALRYMVTGLDRGRAIKRAPAPGPTADQVAAREAEAKAKAEARRAALMDPENPHWWTGSD